MSSVCIDMNNLIASALLDNSSCDPYAFPMDDAVVEETSGTGDPSGRIIPRISVYSKTFSSQKSVASNGKMLPPENGFYPNQNELSLSQYSVTCDSLPTWHHDQQTRHPHSEIKVTHSTKQNDNFSSAQTPEIGLSEQLAVFSHLEQDVTPMQNGVWNLAAETETTETQKTNKKKKRNKTAGGDGNEVAKRKPKKTVKNILNAGSDSNGGAGKAGLSSLQNRGPPSSNAQYLWDNHPGILCAKNAAPQLPVRASASAKASTLLPSENIFWGLPVQCTPTTTTITTVSNSTISNMNYVKCTSSSQRQTSSSQESQSSRPSSSNATTGKSDSSSKQANSIPLSKVMEIIEREKARGSPSPCKRRRTAKPQHIQIAEEEARKFVTAAAANSMEKRLSSIPTAGNLKTDAAKKGLGDGLHSSGLKAEFTASLKKGKKWTGSTASGLDPCSMAEHSKINPASQDVTSQNGQQASSSGIFYSGSTDKLCSSVVNPPEITQMQTFTDKLVSQSLCEPDIQQSFSHQNETSQTPSPSLSTSYTQQSCSNFQLTDSMSSSTQFDTLRTSSTSSENFNQHFMQFSAYDEQTLLSPPHTASVKTEAVSMPNFESSFYSNHNSLLSEGTSPTQWSAEISGDCSTSDVIPHTAVNFAQSANNHQPLIRNMKSQGVSVSTACTDWKPLLSISIKDSYFSQHQSTLPSSLSATSPSKLACESASLNCSHSSSKLYSPAGPIKLHDSTALPSFDALVANSIGSHIEQVQSQLSTMHQQINVERLDLPQQQQKKKSSRNKQKLSESNVGKKKQQSPPKVKNQNPPVYTENFAHSFPGGGARNLHSPLKDANSFKSEVKVNGTQTYSSNKMSSSPNQQLPSPQHLVQSPVQSLPSPNKPLSSTCWQMPSASRLPQSPNQSLPSPSQPAHSPVTKMEPFLSPMNLEEELDDRLRYNKVESAPQCGCLGPNYVYNESVEGPYYTQLGTARDLVAIREIMEKRTGLSGNAIRIEKIHYTGKEGRSAQGCPIAKWIIRRSGVHEKYLCVTRKRPGHFCDAAYIIVAIVAWEGVTTDRADSLYTYLVSMLTKYGMETDRRCGTNEQKTCACQGVDLIRRGASFSFGCSWSMYFNGCKFGRSHTARKFKLKDTQKEAEMEEQMQDLATVVAPLYKAVAPDAYRNQVHFEEQAKMCRLGKEKGRPFSGVTACVDFCAHSHKDFHNMQNGSTVVVTLTKHRELVKPEDEQLHVLPLYVLDETDEYGSTEGHMEKIKAGSLEILHRYPMQARTRSSPVTPKKRGRTPKKESPAKSECKRTGSDLMGSKADASSASPTPTTPSSLEKDTSFLHSHDSSNSLPDVSTISGNSATNSAMHTPEKSQSVKETSFVDKENLSSIDEDTWSQSFEPSQLYDKVWDYFYSNGTFPPTSLSDKRAAAQKLAMIDHQISEVSANRECKPETNSHQASPQPTQQAANVTSQHQCSLSDSQNDVPLAQNTINGIKVEAGCGPGSACNVQSLTNISCHNSVGSVIASFQQVSGTSESLPHGNAHFASAQGDGMSVSTVLGSSLDILSEAAFVNGQAPDQSSLCLSLATSLPRQTSTPGISTRSSSASLTSLHAAPFPPSLVSVASVVYPFITSHSTSDNHKGESLSDKTPFLSAKASCDGGNPSLCNDTSSTSSSSHPVMQPNGSFIMPTLGQGPNEPTFTMMDPSVVKCEWQNNEENFLDPSIGGVAIALNHRAVLFEVAKREVHATTALKNPNRYQPTRISLVFYQHKNLNYSHHGYYEYEHKLKAQRQKRMEKLMEEGATAAEAEVAVKPGRKRKKKTVDGEEEDVVDFAKTSAAQYKYLWDTTVRHSQALTTDSIITRWIDPQPMVTGPYQRWV